jgi:hypothetical protein
MTETLPTTGSRGQPLKIAQYIAEGRRLMALVNDYRAAKGDVTPVSPSDTVDGEPTPTKKKSYPLPALDRPTELPDWPLNPSPPAEAPDCGSMARVQAVKHRQRKVGAVAPMTPIGPSELRKKGRGRP